MFFEYERLNDILFSFIFKCDIFIFTGFVVMVVGKVDKIFIVMIVVSRFLLL